MGFTPVSCNLSVDHGNSWNFDYYGDNGWNSKGDNFYKIGNYNDALESYGKSLYHFTDVQSSVIEDHIGDTLFKLGQYERALEHYLAAQNYGS